MVHYSSRGHNGGMMLVDLSIGIPSGVHRYYSLDRSLASHIISSSEQYWYSYVLVKRTPARSRGKLRRNLAAPSKVPDIPRRLSRPVSLLVRSGGVRRRALLSSFVNLKVNWITYSGDHRVIWNGRDRVLKSLQFRILPKLPSCSRLPTLLLFFRSSCL